eukprot:372268-Hanusia_phi.AAC.1
MIRRSHPGRRRRYGLRPGQARRPRHPIGVRSSPSRLGSELPAAPRSHSATDGLPGVPRQPPVLAVGPPGTTGPVLRPSDSRVPGRATGFELPAVPRHHTQEKLTGKAPEWAR